MFDLFLRGLTTHMQKTDDTWLCFGQYGLAKPPNKLHGETTEQLLPGKMLGNPQGKLLQAKFDNSSRQIGNIICKKYHLQNVSQVDYTKMPAVKFCTKPLRFHFSSTFRSLPLHYIRFFLARSCLGERGPCRIALQSAKQVWKVVSKCHAVKSMSKQETTPNKLIIQGRCRWKGMKRRENGGTGEICWLLNWSVQAFIIRSHRCWHEKSLFHTSLPLYLDLFALLSSATTWSYTTVTTIDKFQISVRQISHATQYDLMSSPKSSGNTSDKINCKVVTEDPFLLLPHTTQATKNARVSCRCLVSYFMNAALHLPAWEVKCIKHIRNFLKLRR